MLVLLLNVNKTFISQVYRLIYPFLNPVECLLRLVLRFEPMLNHLILVHPPISPLLTLLLTYSLFEHQQSYLVPTHYQLQSLDLPLILLNLFLVRLILRPKLSLPLLGYAKQLLLEVDQLLLHLAE